MKQGCRYTFFWLHHHLSVLLFFSVNLLFTPHSPFFFLFFFSYCAKCSWVLGDHSCLGSSLLFCCPFPPAAWSLSRWPCLASPFSAPRPRFLKMRRNAIPPGRPVPFLVPFYASDSPLVPISLTENQTSAEEGIRPCFFFFLTSSLPLDPFPSFILNRM